MAIGKNKRRKATTGHKRVTPSFDKFGNRKKATSYVVSLPARHLKDVDVLSDKRLKVLVDSGFKSAQWRVPTSVGKFQRWASGADETVPTRLAVKHINALRRKPAGLALARELNSYRFDNSQHVWVTGDKQIAGHVPAIKSDPKDVKRSVTTEHGRRDKERARVVSDVWKHGADARHVAATAATLKLFISPGEELLTAKQKKPVFANYVGLGDLQKPAELRKLAGFQQEVREHHKIEFAEALHKAGRSNEVPAQYSAFVGKGKSSAEVRQQIVAAFQGKTLVPNQATRSQADLAHAGGGRLKRSLSSPRLPILPQ